MLSLSVKRRYQLVFGVFILYILLVSWGYSRFMANQEQERTKQSEMIWQADPPGLDHQLYQLKSEQYLVLMQQQALNDQDLKKVSSYRQRVAQVSAFFDRYHAPLAKHAEDFVRAADYYDIDYRLLPAISMVESSGGKKLFRPNNPFGWGKYGFTSFTQAIYHVSWRMADGYYRKGMTQPKYIAPSYNPVTPDAWGKKVESLMKQI